MVPLNGENALLVKRGLRALAGANGPGLTRLFQAARIEGEPGAQQIIFGVVPRLNAVGRMGGAEEAVRCCSPGMPGKPRSWPSGWSS